MKRTINVLLTAAILLLFTPESIHAQPFPRLTNHGQLKKAEREEHHEDHDRPLFPFNGNVDCMFRTQTQGGWGTLPHGHNPGTYRDANFAAAFPDSLVVGCDSGYTLTLTSSQAVADFLPSGGPPRALTSSYVDPGHMLRNVFAGQLVALTLSVEFDLNDPNFGMATTNLADAVITSGTFAGWTVQMVLDEANDLFGGCSSNYSPSQMSDILAAINESFDDGWPHDPDLLVCGRDTCPTLAFNAEGFCFGEPTTITNLSTGVDSAAVYYLDIFNDGSIDISANAADLPDDTTVVFPISGTLDFRAIVVNGNGCSDTLVSSLEIVQCPPDCDGLEVAFDYDDEICQGEALEIENESDGVDPGATYYFDLNSDGSVDASALASDLPHDTSLAIPFAGTFVFTAWVVNPNGCSDTISGQVVVQNCPPDCDDLELNFNVEACVGEPLVIENESQGVDPSATYYLDLFSDGSVDASALASDLPSDTTINISIPAGTYNYKVWVVNPDGCSDTLQGSLEVDSVCGPDCSQLTLNFEYDDTTCVGELFSIENLSTGVHNNATYYLDLFNDGNIDFSAPAHDLPDDTSFTIPFAGTLYFSVIVVNPNGCSDTLVDTIVVLPAGCQRTSGDGGVYYNKLTDGSRNKELSLEVYPNPFRESAIIEFYMPFSQYVKIELFGYDGKKMGMLFNEVAVEKQDYKIAINGEKLSSGIYFVKFTTGSGKVINKKLVLMK